MYVLITTVSILVLTILMWSFSKKRDVPVLPGPRGLPIVGNLIDTMYRPIHVLLREWAKNYGELFAFSLLGKKFVVLNSIDIIRKAFVSTKYRHAFQERPRTFVSKVILPHDVAFTSEMYEHDAMRKIIHKSLNVYGDGVKTFESTLISEIQVLCQRMEKTAGKNVELEVFIRESLSNLLSILLSGKRFEDGDPDVEMFWNFDDTIDKLMEPLKSSMLITLPVLQHIPGMFRNLCQKSKVGKNKIAEKYFFQMKTTHISGQVRGIADVIIDIQEDLLSHGITWFTDVHAQNVIVDIIGAALVTTYMNLSGFFFTMVHHPEVQKQIYEEIVDVIGSARVPTIDDKSQMPYTHATILESLRCLSSLPLLLPHYTSEDIVFDGFFIRRNTIVLAYAQSIHHDSKMYERPWEFRAERFLDNEGMLLPPEHPKRHSLIPFGMGVRQCPGETFAKYRMFLYITSLLQRFEFLPPEGVELPPWDPRTYEHKTTVHAPDFQCRIRLRQQ